MLPTTAGISLVVSGGEVVGGVLWVRRIAGIEVRSQFLRLGLGRSCLVGLFRCGWLFSEGHLCILASRGANGGRQFFLVVLPGLRRFCCCEVIAL